MKKMIALLSCLAILVGMAGCGVLNEPGTTESTGSMDRPGVTQSVETKPTVPLPEDTDGVIDVGVDRLPVPEEELFAQLFDLDTKISVDIDMSAEELQKMQDDYERYRDMGSKSPIYRRADVTITIGDIAYRIADVGVRMKGNTSRTSFYKEEEGGIYKAIHLKLDFQETFDDEAHYGSDAQVWQDDAARQARKDRTFATLEALEMRWNKCYDSTYLKETYAYELYRSEGVLAPYTNLCSFDWSGVHMGVYTINEPVDKVFLEKRLPAEDLGGDLYKCGWTWEGASFTNTGSIGIEDEDKGEFYCYDLKTNKKTSQHEAITALIKGLNSGSLTKEKFAQLVDVDNFVSYAAVSYFLGNPDDLRNNYNNYYLYFLQSSGKAILIPYDYDRCLGVTVEYNPSGHGMTSDSPFSDLREGAQNGPQSQDCPLFKYSVCKGGWYLREYADALTRVSQNTLLQKSTFKQYFDRAAGLYGGDVQPSRTLRNMEGRDNRFELQRTSSFDSQGNISFDQYIDAKMKYFNQYMQDVDDLLNYVRPIPTGYYIRGDFNDWSNRDEYAMESVDGIMTFTLRFSHDFSFKVYNDPEQDWLGEECVAEDNTVPFTTNDHGNIQLKAGTYIVRYDPETMIITLEKK